MRGKCNKEKDISHLFAYFTTLGASFMLTFDIFGHIPTFRDYLTWQVQFWKPEN